MDMLNDLEKTLDEMMTVGKRRVRFKYRKLTEGEVTRVYKEHLFGSKVNKRRGYFYLLLDRGYRVRDICYSLKYCPNTGDVLAAAFRHYLKNTTAENWNNLFGGKGKVGVNALEMEGVLDELDRCVREVMEGV